MYDLLGVILAVVDENMLIVIRMSQHQTMPSRQQAHASDIAMFPGHAFNKTEDIALYFGKRSEKNMATGPRR
jgi:hypothetical protein